MALRESPCLSNLRMTRTTLAIQYQTADRKLERPLGATKREGPPSQLLIGKSRHHASLPAVKSVITRMLQL